MSETFHHEPPSSVIHGELRGKIISPPAPPPQPPLPPPGAGIELLRETVEVQARTIRYLLANYEALLRKVGHDKDREVPFAIEWSLGAPQNFTAQQTIPAGFWTATVTMLIDFDDHQGGWMQGTCDPNDVIYSNGVTRANAAITGAMPIMSKIVHKEE